MLLLRWSKEQDRNCEDQRDEDTECDGRILGQTEDGDDDEFNF